MSTMFRSGRSICLLGALVVASCGGSHRFGLTLLTREIDGALNMTCSPTNGPSGNHPPPDGLELCALVFNELQWVTSDGGRAMTPAHTEHTFTLYAFAGVVCGGKDLGQMERWESGPGLPADDDSFELRLADGNTLMLDQKTGLWGIFDEMKCYQTAGRWRGTAGRLKDRTGTFTILYDSIQIAIKLVED
jgi:hypothetical protein